MSTSVPRPPCFAAESLAAASLSPSGGGDDAGRARPPFRLGGSKLCAGSEARRHALLLLSFFSGQSSGGVFSISALSLLLLPSAGMFSEGATGSRAVLAAALSGRESISADPLNTSFCWNDSNDPLRRGRLLSAHHRLIQRHQNRLLDVSLCCSRLKAPLFSVSITPSLPFPNQQKLRRFEKLEINGK